jgi:deazaflavin-dependent oxidoreductase (nitroreductase family)
MARTPKPYSPAQEKFGRFVTKHMARFNIWLYHKSNGRFGASVFGAPVCMLTTTGRKTGLARTTPLLYLKDGDDVVVVASQGGMPKNPEWYLNLVADPKVTVEIAGDAVAMIARTATADEKAVLWPKLVTMYKNYDRYQQRTTRDIPVVICSSGT